MSPEVSVVIPTYNRANLIGRAIISVLNQTYNDFELIVVDDGSKDNTKEIVDNFKDRRILYLRHITNRGGGAARNTGIKASKGKFVAFLDSDDEWMPEKLRKQMDLFQKLPSNYGAVYSFINLANRHGTFSSKSHAYREFVYEEMLKCCFLHTSTVIFRKNCLEEVKGFDETFLRCHDWDLYLRLAKHYKFDLVPEALATYYLHGNQLSTELSAKIRAYEKLLGKHKKEFDTCPKSLCRFLKYIGILYIISGQSQQARNYFIMSMKTNPYHGQVYVHLLLSYFHKFHKFIIQQFLPSSNGVTLY